MKNLKAAKWRSYAPVDLNVAKRFVLPYKLSSKFYYKLEEAIRKLKLSYNSKTLSVDFENGKIVKKDIRGQLLYAVSNKAVFDRLADGYALLLSRYETPSALPKHDNGLRPYADALVQLKIIELHHVNDTNEYYQLTNDFLEAIKKI